MADDTQTESPRELLVRLENLRAAHDLIVSERENLKIAVFTEEIRQKLAEIDLEFAPQIDVVTSEIENLTALVKAAVAEAGMSIQSDGLIAVYSDGRTTWDDKALLRAASNDPSLMKYRKTGAPSVAIRQR